MKYETTAYLFGSMFLIANRLQTLGDKYLQEITMKQWLLLMMIHTTDREQPSVTEIAKLIGSSRQNVRKMVEVLAAKGYVALAQGVQDRRNLSVALTPKTQRFFAEFDARGTAFLAQLFKDIDSESLESCRHTFEALFKNMERMEQEYESYSGCL